MAGFQQFPIPRYLPTKSSWFYVEKNFSRKNVPIACLSLGLISFALFRFMLLKLVKIYLFRIVIQYMDHISILNIKMPQCQPHSDLDYTP